MSKYILVISQFLDDIYGRDNGHFLRYFENLDDFYHFMVGWYFENEENENDDIINHLNDDIEGTGFDFSLFKSGEQDPIFEMKDGNKMTFKNLEEFCFNIKKSNESIIKFSQFLNESKNKFPNIKKFDIDGFIVMVGKDAASNDHLTFIESKDEDIWMHASKKPGSHVVIKIKDKLPTESIIRKVGEICKENSKAPKEEKISIVYCKRRFVTKNVGSNPGQVVVDYKNASEINI